MIQEFRIIDRADQVFGVVLNRRRCTMRLRYNPTSDRWTFDLSIDDKPVLYGRRIVTGVNLLRAFDFEVGALVALPDSPNKPHEPGRNELINGLVKLYSIDGEDLDG